MLNVGHLNIYHLDNKTPDLSNFLHQCPQPFHLYGVTESRLHNNIPDQSVCIPDYTIIRRDAVRPGETGLAVYVHKSIESWTSRRPDLEHSAIECVWLEVKQKALVPSIYVCFLYRNPAACVEWYDWFAEMVDNVYKSKPQSDILILGDFNIDLLKSQSRWESLMCSLGLTQLINAPTRVTPTSETLLDHIYSNNPAQIFTASLSDLSISDHSPIFCTLNTKLPKTGKNAHTYISFRSFKHFDLNRFLCALSCVPFHEVYSYNDPDQALEKWYQLFLSVLDTHAPIKSKRVKNSKLPQWLSSDIKQAMKERDRLKKDKNFIEYKKQRNKIKNMVRDSKRAFFNKLVETSKDTSKLWRAMNFLIKGQKSADIPSHLSPDTFNHHFLSIADSLLQSRDSTQTDFTCSDTLNKFCQDKTAHAAPFTIPPIAVFEVGNHISKLPNKKSSGPDGISNYILKVSLPYVVESLTHIFNLCVTKNIFPSALKTAKVIPLPKSKQTDDVNNYRPISLLSVISKVLEKHIQRHLTTYLERYQLLHNYQSGFRRSHSCTSTLSLLSQHWLSAVNQSQLSGSVFLDLSKAFDLVNHSILLNKLALYLKSSDSVTLFRSFLENRTQKVYVNGSYSFEGLVKHGVPQGSVLGPILFSIFINDLSLSITTPSVECHMLADDTTFQTSSSTVEVVHDSLQSALNDASAWCQVNHMVLNPAKSKSMLITTRQKHQLQPLSLDLSVDGNTITQVSNHKHLGVIIDDKLRWDAHVDHLCKVLGRNLYLLSKLQSVFTQEARKLFYNAHIQSHLDYASVVWDGTSDAIFKRLNSLYRRAAKLIYPDPSLTTDQKMSAVGMLPLKQHLFYNKAVYMYKILHDKTPGYLKDLFKAPASKYTHHRHKLAFPKPRVDLYKTSISYSGVSVWNSLPVCLRTLNTLPSFKHNLQAYIASTL